MRAPGRVVIEAGNESHCADCVGVGHDSGYDVAFCKLWGELPADWTAEQEKRFPESFWRGQLAIESGRPALCPLRQGWHFILGSP